MMRFFGSLKTCSLRKVEMLSTPALVRVSANITSPSRTRIPPQYVIDSLAPQRGPYSILLHPAVPTKERLSASLIHLDGDCERLAAGAKTGAAHRRRAERVEADGDTHMSV